MPITKRTSDEKTDLLTKSWQIAHIKKGQKQAKNSEFVAEKKWRSAFGRNR